MAHQTAVDIIRVISEAVNPTGQFAYLRTWDASLEFNEVDQKIFLYPISGQVDITNGYFETWTCSMGFFFQDAPDSTNEQREQLITNADVLLKAFILAADTVDGVQFSIVRKRPVYRDMAGTYSGYLVDFTLSLTEDICNGDTPSVIIPVGKTFCELVDECLGISPSGEDDYFLNEQGDWVQVQGGGGAVDSVNGQTGVVVLDADDIAETTNRFWLTSLLKSAYDSAVTWISTNGTNLLNHLTNTSNPHSTTAAQVGAPSGSGTSTGTNTGDQDLTGLQDKRIVVSTNTTAVLDGAYTLVASATFTDPTPAEGKGYSVFIRNGTATIGGTPYSTVGTMIWRLFHSGSWSTYVSQNSLGFTPEDVANKQSTLSTDVNHYYNAPYINALVIGFRRIVAATYTNVSFTAVNTNETVLLSIIIPGGTYVVGRDPFFNALVTKAGTASTTTLKFRTAPVGSALPLTSQTVLGNASGITSANLIIPFTRNFIHIDSASSTIVTGTNTVNDGREQMASFNSLNIDWTVDQEVKLTIQSNNTSADTWTGHRLIAEI